MKYKPLEKIGLHPKDHVSALWWLGILYRKPKLFKKKLEKLPKLTQFVKGILLYLHFLPYIILLCIIGRAYQCKLDFISHQRPDH